VTRPPLPLWAAVLTAAASGPILDAAFPDRGIWPLAFVGIALVLISLVGRRAGAGFLVGLVAGFSFYLMHISWATEFLGDVVPMLALVTLEALFFGVGSMAVTLAYRWLPRVWAGRLGTLGLLPVVIAGLWTAREAIASVWPYGGFAWGRVALSQSQSPVSDLFGWIGISGVSFVMVLLAAVAIEAARYSGARGSARAALAVGVAALVLVIPALPVVSDGSIRVAAVQGNGKAAYLDEREYGDLLFAQLDATEAIDDKTADVVVWPEGGSDVNPITNERAADYFDEVSESFGDVPFISGVITEDGDDIYNSSVLWMPGQGVVDIYNKRHPIPFGEYIPDRAFWRPFAPELIDLVQREYSIGTTDAVFDLGEVTVGVNICFDIVDDQLMTESVRDGAQVIFAQSNNADFGRTDESLQQLAIARIRAMELGRSVVNISTVGTSAIILADGSTLQTLPWYTAGAMVETVPTSSFTTPAVLIGRQVEWLVSFFALAVLLLGGVMGRRRA
jgi:apolipoprotein N-acyltransferase